MLTPTTYWLLLAAVSVFAFTYGRMDERIAAAICIVATIVTWLFNSPLAVRYTTIETGVLAADLLALAGFTLLALHSQRFWPLWVAGLQLTTMIAHLLKAVQIDLMPQAYAAAARFWVYPIFLIIVVGTWRSYRRRLAAQRSPDPA